MRPSNLRTVKQVANPNSPFSESTVRWWIFNAATNGMNDMGVIVRIGDSVYLDDPKLDGWLESHRVVA